MSPADQVSAATTQLTSCHFDRPIVALYTRAIVPVNIGTTSLYVRNINASERMDIREVLVDVKY